MLAKAIMSSTLERDLKDRSAAVPSQLPRRHSHNAIAQILKGHSASSHVLMRPGDIHCFPLSVCSTGGGMGMRTKIMIGNVISRTAVDRRGECQ